jgi:UDP-2-acetamido-3-amino-2,3-dideoxy-glucuronate N-acetyltransferase
MNKIHSSSIISKTAKIGDNVEIGMFVIIGDNVEIGNDVSFKAFCEIRNGCKIGNDVSFGSRCTLAEDTIVDSNVTVKYGVVATDTPKIGNAHRNPCHLKKGSKFGANVTLMPGITIGENSEIGACSQVRHNVPDNEVWYGNPAKLFRKIN